MGSASALYVAAGADGSFELASPSSRPGGGPHPADDVDALLRALPRGAPQRCGLVSHELYFWHHSGLESLRDHVQPHPSSESPETKRRLRNLIAVTPLEDALVHLKPRAATDEELLRVHTARYLASVREVSARGGGFVGHELHLSRGGAEIAALSAGGVLAATDAVLSGRVRAAYALVRPPGHHAEADRGHGFCAYNNVAVAAAAALACGAAKRVAVVDYDVHHGNGTQAAFYERSDVLVVSVHQDGLYPLHTGGAHEVGAGAGRGYTLNVPLPAGSGIGAYRHAFARVVLPALGAFRPDVILVSSGFDPAFLDPLGRMLLRAEDFGWMARSLRRAADELCDGRVVFAHEGGYSELYVPFCGVAVLEELAGVHAGVVDPFAGDVGPERTLLLQPHQAAAVDAAAKNLAIALVKSAPGE